MNFNGTFFATIITFIVFVFVMNKILYAPILEIMEARKKFIDENYQNARQNDNKSDELNAERETQLDYARNDARKKYLESIAEFKKGRDDKISAVQSDIKEKLQTSGDELLQLSNEVKNELKSSMTNLAGDIVEKVLGYRSEVEGFDDETVNSVLWGDK